MKIMFGSVLYNDAFQYLPEFLASLVDQTEKEYDTIFLNDDIEEEKLNKLLSKYALQKSEVLHVSKQTPIQLRIQLLKSAKERGVDILILGDCDDFFSKNRIEEVICAYKDHPDITFFYNEIKDMSGEMLMPELPDTVENYWDIGEYNYLGLSNTAINMKKIDNKTLDSLREFDGKIFDWYLFSRLLLCGLMGKKVRGCCTVYRIHENNMVGIPERSAENINREIEVKKKQYSILKKYNCYYRDLYEHYMDKQIYESSDESEKKYWWNLLKIKEG